MTERPRRACNAGFTLLELALSLALGAALMSAFFVGFQGLIQAIGLVASEARGSAQVAELLETMGREIDQADSVNSFSSFTLDLTIGGQAVRYRLVASSPTASGDAWIERQQGLGSWVRVGPRGVLANLRPFQGIVKSATNGNIGGYNLVPFFSSAAVPAPGGHTPRVTLHAVVQPNQGAPVRYLRTVATPRVPN